MEIFANVFSILTSILSQKGSERLLTKSPVMSQPEERLLFCFPLQGEEDEQIARRVGPGLNTNPPQLHPISPPMLLSLYL